MTQTRWTAEAIFDGPDDVFDRLKSLGVADQRLVGQWKTLSRHHQGQHDLLAIAAVIAGVAAFGQFVLLGQALEVSAGQIVEQQVVVELEQAPSCSFRSFSIGAWAWSNRSRVR